MRVRCYRPASPFLRVRCPSRRICYPPLLLARLPDVLAGLPDDLIIPNDSPRAQGRARMEH